MVEVHPFSGLLYNLEQAGPIPELIAPPYDVIDPEMQESLYQRNPCNIVRLILGNQFPEDTEQDNRYTRSSQIFNDWQNNGILVQDEQPAFYIYRQRYTFGGRTLSRTGFFARVKLEEFSAGNICPHEFTLSKAKQDRAQLIRACRANFSPIFGLFSDPEMKIDRALVQITETTPWADIDDNGVINQLWRVTDPEILTFLSSQFSDQKIYIADGHHRYETALGYFNEHGKEVPGAQWVMMFLTNLDAEGLAIFPFHRLIKTREPVNPREFSSTLSEWFEVSALDNEFDGDRMIKTLEEAGKDRIAFCIYFGKGQGYLLVLKDPDCIQPFMGPDDADDLKVLDVFQLHTLILKHQLGIDTQNPEHQKYIGYNVHTQEVINQVDEGQYDLAFFLNATRLDQVRSLAEKGIRLPQKATYFYPKLLSGLVINRLDA